MQFFSKERRLDRYSRAIAAALLAQPAAFTAPAFAQDAAPGYTDAAVPSVGGNYIRSEDARGDAQVLTRLGTAPFARSRPEAFEHLEQAVDALMQSENIPAQYREQILNTIRGNSNFANYNIRGVAPGEMSSTEVVDAMMSEGGHVVGAGAQMVRMETPVVPGTVSGHTGYRAERWVVEATVGGRNVLLVFTRPDECNNWSVKIINREDAPVARAPEAVASPCAQVEIVPPAGVNFDDRTVSARVVIVDARNPLLMAPQQCVTRQVTQNCDTVCEDHLLRAAAARSEGFRALLQRNRGEHASLIYQADAELVRQPDGHFMLKLPLEVSQMNDNQAYIVCFDWDNGGSSVDVIYNARVRRGNTDGVLTDTLSMARGGNMDVFHGSRIEFERRGGTTVYQAAPNRVVRGSDH